MNAISVTSTAVQTVQTQTVSQRTYVRPLEVPVAPIVHDQIAVPSEEYDSTSPYPSPLAVSTSTTGNFVNETV